MAAEPAVLTVVVEAGRSQRGLFGVEQRNAEDAFERSPKLFGEPAVQNEITRRPESQEAMAHVLEEAHME